MSELDELIGFLKAELSVPSEYQRGLVNGMILARRLLAGAKGCPAFLPPATAPELSGEEAVREAEGLIGGGR